MIKKFNEVPQHRDGGAIYWSYFEKIKMMHDIDPALAGELAISMFEQILTGQVSSDNKMVKMALTEVAQTSNKNAKEFEKKVEAQKEARIEKLALRKIAAMYNQGRPQREIGEAVGVTQQVVSNRIATIRKDFPELLEVKIEEKDVNAPTKKDDKFYF